LYKQFGTDEALKKLFQGKPDAYLQKRLEEELSVLMEKPKVVLQSAVKKGDADEMPKSTDPVLEALRNEWMPLYSRMNYLRHELDRYEGNTEEETAKRQPIAFEILELEQKCMAIWTKRDHYLEHGQLPEVKENEEPLPEDPLQLGREIETTKRNLRRNKQLAEKHPDNAVYPLKVKQYEAKLQRILNKLKGNEGTEK
jgi:hypothetical protein